MTPLRVGLPPRPPPSASASPLFPPTGSVLLRLRPAPSSSDSDRRRATPPSCYSDRPSSFPLPDAAPPLHPDAPDRGTASPPHLLPLFFEVLVQRLPYMVRSRRPLAERWLPPSCATSYTLRSAPASGSYRIGASSRAIRSNDEVVTAVKDTRAHHDDFVAAIGYRILEVENNLNESNVAEGRGTLSLVHLDDDERGDLAAFLSAGLVQQ